MSGDTELPWLWPWPALLLLGTVTGLCMRCSHPGVKKTGKIYQQRNLQENNQSFQVAQTYSLVRQVWPGPLTDVTPPDPSSPRYQNFSKGVWWGWGALLPRSQAGSWELTSATMSSREPAEA
ncbi:linker for activation of T-cells family member 2 [Thomomys bottae]